MGTDKAFIEIDGRPLVVRVVDALHEAGADSVIVIGGDVARLHAIGLAAIADPRPSTGPVGGLVSALELADEPDLVVVLSCDLLDPSPDAIRQVVNRLALAPCASGVVPIVAGRHQWLHAGWRTSAALGPVRKAFDERSRSFSVCTQELHLVVLADLPAESVADADVPEDLPSHARRWSVEPPDRRTH